MIAEGEKLSETKQNIIIGKPYDVVINVTYVALLIDIPVLKYRLQNTLASQTCSYVKSRQSDLDKTFVISFIAKTKALLIIVNLSWFHNN